MGNGAIIRPDKIRPKKIRFFDEKISSKSSLYLGNSNNSPNYAQNRPLAGMGNPLKNDSSFGAAL